jgi:uncharacterized Zn-binding protein involved in type VI secretion
MSKSVAINPPKTPCTTETRGFAKVTTPNVCKMPGPPAPFVPTPLPNIGKSNLSPKGYSTTVKIEGQTVAIRGATFESIGDMASKGTGGGLISANTHGPTKFITPGSMNVKIEGKNVHLLGEPMLNNCGPSGSPPNTGATMAGFDTWDLTKGKPLIINCKDAPEKPSRGRHKFDECEQQEICAKLHELNQEIAAGLKARLSKDKYIKARAKGNAMAARLRDFAMRGSTHQPDLQTINKAGFNHLSKTPPPSPDGCAGATKDKAEKAKPPYSNMSADHRKEIQFMGSPTDLANLKWMSRRPNRWIGGKLRALETSGPNKHTHVAGDCC